MKPAAWNKALWSILGIAVLLRLAAAFYLGNTVVALPGTFDQLSYHNLALRVLDGHGFTFGEPWWPATPAGEPTAHWSYLYTYFLVAVYWLFGPHPLAARLVQVVIVGVLHPYLAYVLGRELFNEVTGLVAAGITAVYLYFIYYAAALMTEPFYITAILLSLLLAVRLARSAGEETGRGRILALQLGLALGAAILLRQLFLLMVPLIYLWIWWPARKRQVVNLLLTTAVVGLMILPATLYNARRFDSFVLLNTNAGFAFFWGNNPIYGYEFQPILNQDETSYGELIPVELRSLDEAALDRELLKRGLQFVVEDPGRYLILSLSRIPPYFMFWPSAESSLISNLARLGSFTITLPFMVLGLFQALKRRPSLSSPLVLMLLLALGYTGVHVLIWTLIRYRLPVDGVMVIFAAYALVNLVGWPRIAALVSQPLPNGLGDYTGTFPE